VALQLTPEEVERYRPYHTIPDFEWGYTDYEAGIWSAALKRNILNPDSFAAQAYESGAECAMRRKIRRALSQKDFLLLLALLRVLAPRASGGVEVEARKEII
jgi:hypothetical protein